MKKTKKYRIRPTPLFLALVFVFETIYPTAAFALTSGASQPETGSFEPVGTTQLVDPFTGDFNYNIPLLTVPGPNGGYPVNLSYHAGIGPETEASWVGLGWNLNAGAINRNMRGLPDDFFGSDIVKRSMNIKPNWIFGLNASGNAEIFGFDPKFNKLAIGLGLSYNNYKGLNVQAKIKTLEDYKIGLLKDGENKYRHQLSIGFDYTFDAQDGPSININPTLKSVEEDSKGTLNNDRGKSPEAKANEVKKDKDGKSTGSDKEKSEKDKAIEKEQEELKGKKGYKLLEKKYKNQKDRYNKIMQKEAAKAGKVIDFANPAFAPKTAFPEGGFDVTLWAKFGAAFGGAYPNSMIKAFFFFQKLKDRTLDFPSYGYLYSGERNRMDKSSGRDYYLKFPGAPQPQVQDREGMALMDFNRNDNGIKRGGNLPVPIHTFDVFSASAQGMGMVFRPYRRDLGILYNSRVSSDFTDAEFGIEPGAGALLHIGFNPGITYTHLYSGRWKSRKKDFEEKFAFTNTFFGSNDEQSDDPSSIFKDPFFFKSTGDKTMDLSDTRFKGDELINFEMTSLTDYLKPNTSSLNNTINTILDFDPANYGLSIVPKIKNNAAGVSFHDLLLPNKNNYRADEYTSTSIGYKNRYEKTNTQTSVPTTMVPQLYTANEFPYLTTNVQGQPISYALDADKKGHHLAEFSVTNPDGNIYVFGLPVYNLKDREVSFSTVNNTGNNSVVNYNTTNEATLDNKNGVENFYSSTDIPAYATSYMLTAVYSPDYVDVTGDGPSADDLGHYVKFNYSKITPPGNLYKWRVPLSGAIRAEGYMDNDGDDKAIYKYGEKEIYYLNSIETKTHFAVFDLNNAQTEPRLDGLGAAGEVSTLASSPNVDLGLNYRQRYLKSIRLFSKSNTSVPVKTVHFKYSYTLCPGTKNSQVQSPANPTGGKLTLEQVYFTYLSSDKGSLTPYKFSYNTYNPSYHELLADRWGNYKEDITVPGNQVNYLVDDFPYVDQKKPLTDLYASAWCLTSVQLPSGGILKVDYESDDYQYVQDKNAMQMCRITGTGYVDGNQNIVHNGFSLENDPASSRHNWTDLVFFELEEGIKDQATLDKYLENIKDKYMYFKVNIDLKRKFPLQSNIRAYDYVDGYCRLNKDFGIKFDPASAYTVGSDTYYNKACIRLDFHKTGIIGDLGKVHPFRKSAFEYMKMKRPELFFPLNNTSELSNFGTQAVSVIVNSVKSMGYFFFSYYKYCKILGYASHLADGSDSNTDYDDNRHSYLRLSLPDGKKLGGGHRVKRISINNQWNLTDVNSVKEYGVEYDYTLPNGTSSGVAENEPSTGKEENAMVLPADGGEGERLFVSRLKEVMQEKPYCESYYPGPSVGYSRVTMRTLKREDSGTEVNKTTADGVTVHEFYTAKDFPVKEEISGTESSSFKKDVVVPFIGKIKWDASGTAQGYKVTLNDMHGKPKSIATYPHNTNFSVLNPKPSHEVTYKYNLHNGALDNKVTVLTNDGFTTTAEIGVERDFTMDMDENTNFTIDAGLALNVDAALVLPPIPVFFVNAVPIINFSRNTYRSFVNVKTVYRQAILTETVVKSDDVVTTYKNLMFDAYSGRPLLTTVENTFGKPVYHYDMPAHWYYRNMGNKSAVYKYASSFSYVGSGKININNGASAFSPGDKVRISQSGQQPVGAYSEYWITAVTPPSTFELRDRLGNLYNHSPSANNLVTMIEPARRHLLNEDAGQIISLTNPATESKSPLFEAFNTLIATFPTNSPPPLSGVFSYVDCLDGNVKTVNYSYDVNNKYIDFGISAQGGTGGCKLKLFMPSGSNHTNYNTFTYSYSGSGDVQIKAQQNTFFNMFPLTGTVSDPNGCLSSCLEGVLHAEATRFADTWDYDYADLGDPVVYSPVSNPPVYMSTAVQTNPYVYGKSGTWRFHQKYYYQTDRKQQSGHTDIATDGTYKVFNKHNWTIGEFNGSNSRWSKKWEVSRYSHYGFELERFDWLNVYQSMLYGYDNTEVIAVGENTAYDQLSFMDFETAQTVSVFKAGHLNVKYASASPLVVSTIGHTGNKSLAFGNQTLLIGGLQYDNASYVPGGNYHIVPGKEYVLSAWIRNTANTSLPTFNFPPGTTVTSVTFAPDVVDGWRRVDAVFSFNGLVNGSVNEISINAIGIGKMQIDDLRIQPFNSQVTTFVYDPVDRRLVAELNDRNFATFYAYDEEGQLVDVKRETEKGITTLKSIRKNLVRP